MFIDESAQCCCETAEAHLTTGAERWNAPIEEDTDGQPRSAARRPVPRHGMSIKREQPKRKCNVGRKGKGRCVSQIFIVLKKVWGFFGRQTVDCFSYQSCVTGCFIFYFFVIKQQSCLNLCLKNVHKSEPTILRTNQTRNRLTRSLIWVCCHFLGCCTLNTYVWIKFLLVYRSLSNVSGCPQSIGISPELKEGNENNE